MNKVTALTLLLWPLTVGIAHGETPSIESIRDAMDKAWKNVSALSGDVTTSFVMPFGEKPLDLTGKGTMHVLRENGKDKFRKTMTARLPEPFAMEMKLDVLYDGKKVYTTTELMGQSQKQEGEPSLRQGALPPGGSALIAAMEKEMELKVLPNDTFGGQPVFVLEGRARDPQIPFSKVVVYLDQALGIQRKVEIYQEDGTIGISEVVENIQLNSTPDASLFTPPK